MEYRSLENESPARIHECFRESFSDYIIKIELPFEKFRRHIQRYGVDFRYSIGLYDGSDLVGFILNGIGPWKGLPTVYDAGTGIIKEYRGKKYSKIMFKTLVDEILEERFAQYLLEVIQSNSPALNLYKNQGFVIQRELSCFKISRDSLHSHTKLQERWSSDRKNDESGQNIEIRRITSPQWPVLKKFWSFQPSWQNSIRSVERTGDFMIIGAYRDKRILGYAVFDPHHGNIIQISVDYESRSKGIGTSLVKKIAQETVGCPNLRVLNVEKKERDTMEFYTSLGFENDVDQYEMLLDLRK